MTPLNYSTFLGPFNLVMCCVLYHSLPFKQILTGELISWNLKMLKWCRWISGGCFYFHFFYEHIYHQKLLI